MPTDNVQISDVLNSHLINPGFLYGHKNQSCMLLSIIIVREMWGAKLSIS